MSIDNSFYTPKYKANIQTEDELYDFLTKLFPDAIFTAEQGSHFKSLLSLILHLCGPLSLSAAELFLGSFFTTNSTRAKLSRLVKGGCFLSYPMKGNDMNSRVLYSLSKTQGNLIKTCVPDLGSDTFYYKKNSNILHSYGIGLSTLNLLPLGIPFRYTDEEEYQVTGFKNTITKIRVDREFSFYDKKYWGIYLEQDMGSERTNILLTKMLNYHECYRCDPDVHLVFSSHAIIPYEKLTPKYKTELGNTEPSVTEIFQNYVQRQYSIAKRKYQKLCKELVSFALYNESYHYSRLTDAFSTYVTPSVMLSNNYYLYSPESSGFVDTLRTVLGRYIPRVKTATYGISSEQFYCEKDYPSIRYRNCFTLDSGTLLCIEHIGQDVCGFLRTVLSCKIKEELKKKLFLVCLCDSIDDIHFFMENTGYISWENKPRIYFMITNELQSEYPLILPTKDNDSYKLQHIRPQT